MIAVAFFSALAAAQAAAQASPRSRARSRPVVAVLPPTTNRSDLEIYRRPVAAAVVARLRHKVDMHVEPLSLSHAVPAVVDLVVDCRIVASSGRKVTLEARVRDPGRGLARPLISTRPLPLTRIDVLADRLADALAPALVRAEADKRAERDPPHRLPAAILHRDPASGPAAPASASPAASTSRSSSRTAGGSAAARAAAAPAMVVVTAQSFLRSGGGPVSAIVTEAADTLARRLGFRPEPSRLRGVLSPRAVAAELRRTGARYALMAHVLSIHYVWRGVLTARARTRVVVVDAALRALYDRVIRTDTVVGSRGDGYDALTHFVAAEVMDIAAARLRKVLAR